jgi:hypothetical protein
VVSERYAAIDDAFRLEVVDDVLKSAGYRDDVLVRAAATGPHTILRITVPSFGVAVKRDDIIEWGLDIANSELGLRSVQITPVTHRLVYTNGMRAWKSEAGVRMRHVGDADRPREQLRDAVPVAFAEAKGDIARWVKATELLIGNALEEIEGLRAFGLSTGEVQSIGRTLAVDEGCSLPPHRICQCPAQQYFGVRARERHHSDRARAHRRSEPAQPRKHRPPLPQREGIIVATSKLIEALVRAAGSGDVRRAVAEALFTLVVVAARSYAARGDEEA